MEELITIEEAARICYEANRAYALALGDTSFPDWSSAPSWQQETNITGVKYFLRTVRYYGDGSERLRQIPERLHESWMEQKRADGWGYGPVKDAEKKEHPCFVPYSELPKAQRAKDHIFAGILRGLLSSGMLQA